MKIKQNIYIEIIGILYSFMLWLIIVRFTILCIKIIKWMNEDSQAGKTCSHDHPNCEKKSLPDDRDKSNFSLSLCRLVWVKCLLKSSIWDIVFLWVNKYSLRSSGGLELGFYKVQSTPVVINIFWFEVWVAVVGEHENKSFWSGFWHFFLFCHALHHSGYFRVMSSKMRFICSQK